MVSIIEKKSSGAVYFEVTTEEIRVIFSNRGARIISIFTKDRDGKEADVVLGIKDLEADNYYERDGSYMGAVVGRVANRIRGGKFTLNGTEYTLALNNGPNHLHGGLKGFDQKLFSYKLLENGVRFSCQAEDMEEGYPGRVILVVDYVVKGNRLSIIYNASSDKDSLLNVTNHAYFNLSGAHETVFDHQLYIDADIVAGVDSDCCATGEMIDVTGTPFDFRTPAFLGERIQADHIQNKNAGGIDHPFLFNGPGTMFLYHPASGRKVSIQTDLPSVQIYTGNYLKDGKYLAKDGQYYDDFEGVAIETQYLPDSIHLEDPPKTILKKGETFYSMTTYTFTAE